MKKIYYIISGFLLLGLGACEDELNQVPISDASTASFYRNATDFEQAVNGVYSTLRGYPDRAFYLSEVRSDNVYGVGEAGVRDWEPINNFAATLATNPIVKDAWDSNYQGIFRANTVLDQLVARPDVITDENLENRLEAEARFLRAFFYFDLIRTFGKVPLIEHTLTPEEVLLVPRSPVAEVYNLVISDLEFAIQNLDETYAVVNRGRATKNAARGILARVYLTRSGPNYGIEGPGMASGEYSKALPLLNDIIASNRHSLVSPYSRIFAYDNENNAEVIFDVQYRSGGLGIGATFPGTMAPTTYFSAAGIPFAGNLEIIPVSNNLLNSYPAGDVRKSFTIHPNYTYVNRVFEPRAFFRKYLNETGRGQDRFDWPINYIELRYADVLLMKAEAILQGAAGTRAEVDNLVNQVRSRAGLTTPLTNVDLRQLMEERRREFAAEGLRWHDLVRSGLVLEVMNAWAPQEDIRNQIRKPITANHIIYPIPTSEMDVKEGLYEQNPGY
ncbi:membrane protein [Adhaeribacter aerolatus]|uniref:Membrane protein n=1 Tax=Adhaeribacter aerolatus TaxID=670289 RepID=A0A512B2A1_9BACT|nr:RagB/SusD family nutrient uptake outer membrane protein [Adhaeribacter aerolatus]GEO06093.1 membrane protein [Adhaeribacter aerolatus]